ncbi:hypothetical protein Bca52824_072057 [Brassica carinata]|uniref:Uncharacterized protein n=1 Tax=Brassica carinata TaxID=52824 RepID=A0A8X7QBB5_BRACI|nr:hypothetical protein Bca52824_072057 [Brassica carinata]
MHPVLLGFKPAPPFVCSLLVLSVLLGLCYGYGLLLSTAVGFVSPKAAVFGNSWLSSLQVVIGSVWLLSPCPFSAAGAGDRSSLIHRWCGAYLRVNFRLHLRSAHCRFQVFGVWSLAWVIANTLRWNGLGFGLYSFIAANSVSSLLLPL